MTPLQRAVLEAQHDGPHTWGFNTESPDAWHNYVQRIISVLREPSEAMVLAGTALSTEPHYSGSQDAVVEQWQAMIDAAGEEG